MRIIRDSREGMWRAIEWSFVMAVLSWLLVRMWTESLYDPNRSRERPNWFQRSRARLIAARAERRHEGADDRSRADQRR